MTREYRPRRQSSRWLDGDCPPGVLAIYDDPRFTDRYTVIYRELLEAPGGPWLQGRGMSSDPFHPQGVGASFENRASDIAQFRYRERNRACRWTDLPEAVRECVRLDLAESERTNR